MPAESTPSLAPADKPFFRKKSVARRLAELALAFLNLPFLVIGFALLVSDHLDVMWWPVVALVLCWPAALFFALLAGGAVLFRRYRAAKRLAAT